MGVGAIPFFSVLVGLIPLDQPERAPCLKLEEAQKNISVFFEDIFLKRTENSESARQKSEPVDRKIELRSFGDLDSFEILQDAKEYLNQRSYPLDRYRVCIGFFSSPEVSAAGRFIFSSSESKESLIRQVFGSRPVILINQTVIDREPDEFSRKLLANAVFVHEYRHLMDWTDDLSLPTSKRYFYHDIDQRLLPTPAEIEEEILRIESDKKFEFFVEHIAEAKKIDPLLFRQRFAGLYRKQAPLLFRRVFTPREQYGYQEEIQFLLRSKNASGRDFDENEVLEWFEHRASYGSSEGILNRFSDINFKVENSVSLMPRRIRQWFENTIKVRAAR